MQLYRVKILLLQVDKTQDMYISEGIGIYAKRLTHYAPFDMATINVPKNLRQRPVNEQKSGEAELILKQLTADDVLVLLDEKGRQVSSEEFSKFVSQRQNASVKRLVFLIGGPFGFDEVIYKRAQFQVSLSKMTFSHQMVRLFFVEQLYRAFTILRGEKYHHI